MTVVACRQLHIKIYIFGVFVHFLSSFLSVLWKTTLCSSSTFSSLQIHSLTARSVPRQFREDLRKNRPEMPLDKNIRLPKQACNTDAQAHTSDENSDECHIIYDSQNKDSVPYPDAEFIRTPSPEHSGIPAGPVKMPPIRSWQSAATSGQNSTVGYTSDDSNVSLEPVKPARRKVSKQNSNPSVRSLVEKYNC